MVGANLGLDFTGIPVFSFYFLLPVQLLHPNVNLEYDGLNPSEFTVCDVKGLISTSLPMKTPNECPVSDGLKRCALFAASSFYKVVVMLNINSILL